MKTREEKTKRAEVALKELELNAVNNADKTRFSRVWAGLRALDDEQAAEKERVERLREALKELKEKEPTWEECVCKELPKSERPCIVCTAHRQWHEDRGIPRLTPGENAFFAKHLASVTAVETAKEERINKGLAIVMGRLKQEREKKR